MSANPKLKPLALFTSISCDMAPDKLFIDTYQRPLGNRHLPIVRDFDEHRFETLAINDRTGKGGSYAVIDGQARLVAARELRIPEIPCRVYTGMTAQEEAILFVKLQMGRKNLRPYDRFHANEFAGDESTLEIRAIISKETWDIGPEFKPGILGAVAAVEKLHRLHGPLVFRRTLHVITEVWGSGDSHAVSTGMLLGLSQVLAVSFDDALMISRLQRKRPSDVFRLAGAMCDAKTVLSAHPRYVAQAIISITSVPLSVSLDQAARTRKGTRPNKRRKKSA
jgi:hypothetical protein